MKVIIIGAGASYGLLGKAAPMAKDFGKCLHDLGFITDYPNLQQVVKYLTDQYPPLYFPDNDKASLCNWPYDKIWTAIDNRWKLRGIVEWDHLIKLTTRKETKEIYKIQKYNLWDFAHHELLSAVLRIYGRNLQPIINKNVNEPSNLRSEFEKLDPNKGDCVVTFNCDMLSEELFRKTNIHYIPINVATDQILLEQKITLCKLHGSVNWKIEREKDTQKLTILSEPMDERDYNEIENGKETTPGIIGPAHHKSELLFPEIQGNNFVFFNLLLNQWRVALEKITHANELVVAGYRFPVEDEHTIYMISEALARVPEDEKVSKTITVYHPFESSCKVIENISKLFTVKSITCKGKIQLDEKNEQV